MKKIITIACILLFTASEAKQRKVLLCNYSSRYTLTIGHPGIKQFGASHQKANELTIPPKTAFAVALNDEGTFDITATLATNPQKKLIFKTKTGTSEHYSWPRDGVTDVNDLLTAQKPDKDIWIIDAGIAFFVGTRFPSTTSSNAVKIKGLSAKTDNALSRFAGTFPKLTQLYNEYIQQK